MKTEPETGGRGAGSGERGAGRGDTARLSEARMSHSEPPAGAADGKQGPAEQGHGEQRPAERGHGEQELRRSLGFRDLVVYGLLFIAPMAPVGVFGALDARSHGAVALVYVVATVAMAFTAFS